MAVFDATASLEVHKYIISSGALPTRQVGLRSVPVSELPLDIHIYSRQRPISTLNNRRGVLSRHELVQSRLGLGVDIW